MEYTVFQGLRKVSSGSAAQVADYLKNGPHDDILVFDDATGTQIDIADIGGNSKHVVENLHMESRGRGRPRLGVVAREVTLLPRHWDWLNLQPAGASAALRKLVDEARRESGNRDRVGAAQEAVYRFMSAVATNLPGFEDAAQALFAYDRRRFTQIIAAWPNDVRDYAVRLAFADQA